MTQSSSIIPDSQHNYQIPSEQVINQDLVNQLLSIGNALSGSDNLEELLHLILSKSREITSSDAGSVYLISNRKNQHPELIFKAAQNYSLPNISFTEYTIGLTEKSLAGYVALTGKSLNIIDAYQLDQKLPYQFDRRFDRDFNYRTVSLLVLPMKNGEGETIGVLQLINHKQSYPDLITPQTATQITQPYSLWEEKIITSLASQAAISIERNNLQESIENLFEGFVKASIQAIEARDPTTAGHSERVAQLTVRLSEEVNQINHGLLKNIHFNDRQLQEIRYASLLHDFGKISVPEAVLQKEKKLYPTQLAQIKSRITILQRSLKMECAQAKYTYLLQNSSHPHPDPLTCEHCIYLNQLEQELTEKIDQLNQGWAIIQQLNQPQILAKFDYDEQIIIQKLKQISTYNYEDLTGEIKPLLTPEELTTLLISKGTLTNDEREQIEAHVTYTQEFLKQIPWTKHLQNIPLIAGTHHEKLDGTGYPQGLTALHIPIQAQIMTIADIYDALTASDRPYKRRLSLSRSLHILQSEADQQKINKDLLEIFIQRQVYTILGHDQIVE